TQVTFVRPSARIRRIVLELVSLGRPITGNEFRGRYGSPDTLAKIAPIPWGRIERNPDGFFCVTILEELRGYCARYLLRPQLTRWSKNSNAGATNIASGAPTRSG